MCTVQQAPSRPHHVDALRTHMSTTLLKKTEEMSKKYQQAAIVDAQRLAREKMGTDPLNTIPPRLPPKMINIFDELVSPLLPKINLQTAEEKQQVIVETMSSREKNISSDVQLADKYTRMAQRLLQRAVESQATHTPAGDLATLLNAPPPTPPTIPSLEATTKKEWVTFVSIM